MSSRFVVEKDGRTVGLALRCRGGFRFFASEPLLRPLDGLLFPRIRALLHAVHNKGMLQAKKGAPDYQNPSLQHQARKNQP